MSAIKDPVTLAVIIASLVVAYLIAQPDLVLSPFVKVLLGAANVALTAWARLSAPPVP